jgi:hypothetical protein
MQDLTEPKNELKSHFQKFPDETFVKKPDLQYRRNYRKSNCCSRMVFAWGNSFVLDVFRNKK